MTYLAALLADWRIFSVLWVLWLGYSAWLSALIDANAATLRKRGILRYCWKLGAVAAVFWFVESVITDDTTALQATLSACVLIAMLRTAYQIGYWNEQRDKTLPRP